MKINLLKYYPSILVCLFVIPSAYATNCVESNQCPPQNPLDVLNLFDVWFGSGMSLMVMALIIGMITLAIYVRNRSLPMLAILGIYEFSAFAAVIINKNFASQDHYLVYVVAIGFATAASMMILRLVKE